MSLRRLGLPGALVLAAACLLCYANGLTGDPWTPIETKDGDVKALTVDASGFSYKRLSRILFENGFKQAPLQQIGREDPQGCSYVLICRALARGEGKTEGLHERRISMPPKAAVLARLALESAGCAGNSAPAVVPTLPGRSNCLTDSASAG